MTSKSLKLFRQGKPYSFIDESIGREWTINPFGFILKSEKDGGKSEAGIQLDWEHEDYRWFDPDEVNESESFEGVPRILESLRRVWFDIDLGKEAGSALGNGLLVLQRDHESGARQLASKALDIYMDVISKLDASSRDLWWKNVRYAGWHLWKNGRESMGASILTVVLSSLTIIEQKLHARDSQQDFLEGVVLELKNYSQQRQDASAQISEAFRTFVEDNFAGAKTINILTLSSSSTITESIVHVLKQGRPSLDIRVLESRPLFEGVTMAQKLATLTKTLSPESNVTVYTDASAGIAAKDVDLVLIGADLINKEGDVSNKTGSLPAVLAAKHISPKAQVIALSEKEKILPFKAPGHEDNDFQELIGAWGDVVPQEKADNIAHVNVKNVYFEWVAASLIDCYVTEEGVTSSDGIGNWAHDVQSRADRFFTNL